MLHTIKMKILYTLVDNKDIHACSITRCSRAWGIK